MAFSAKLHIEGHEKEQEGFPLVSCDFSFYQQINADGTPAGRVHGGNINIQLRNVNDRPLFYWMWANSEIKGGKIVFSSGASNQQPFQTIRFENSLCINFHQTFSETSEILVNLTIACPVIEISGAKWERLMPGK